MIQWLVDCPYANLPYIVFVTLRRSLEKRRWAPFHPAHRQMAGQADGESPVFRKQKWSFGMSFLQLLLFFARSNIAHLSKKFKTRTRFKAFDRSLYYSLTPASQYSSKTRSKVIVPLRFITRIKRTDTHPERHIIHII